MERKQEYWGGLAAWYLFLAALGAMMVVTVAVSDLLGVKITGRVNGWVSLAAIAAAGTGSLLLLLELTHSARAYLVYARPASIMGMGSYIQSAFLGLGLAYATFFFDLVPWSGLIVVRKLVAVPAMVAALGLAWYPGLELAEARGRSFWNAGGLVSLFLISGAATGLAGVIIVLVLLGYGLNQYTDVISRFLAGALVLQFIAVISYVWGAKLSGAAAAKRSADNVLRGDFRIAFWGGIIGLGTAAPLALGLTDNAPLILAFEAVLVLIGAVSLRSVFLQAAVRIAVPGEESEAISDAEAVRLAVILEQCWQKKAGWLNPGS